MSDKLQFVVTTRKESIAETADKPKCGEHSHKSISVALDREFWIAMNLLQLKSLANNRSFARGEAYFKDERVRSLAEHEGTLTAIVSGQDDYCVTLRSSGREIEY